MNLFLFLSEASKTFAFIVFAAGLVGLNVALIYVFFVYFFSENKSIKNAMLPIMWTLVFCIFVSLVGICMPLGVVIHKDNLVLLAAFAIYILGIFIIAYKHVKKCS